MRAVFLLDSLWLTIYLEMMVLSFASPLKSVAIRRSKRPKLKKSCKRRPRKERPIISAISTTFRQRKNIPISSLL